MEDIQGEVAIGVIEKEGKYLLVRRSEKNSSSGKWVFPGGKIQEDEKPKKAVKREIKEETGLNTEIRESGDTYLNRGELGLWKIYPFLLKSDSKEVDLDYEHDKYDWVEIPELDNFDTLGEMKAIHKLGLD